MFSSRWPTACRSTSWPASNGDCSARPCKPAIAAAPTCFSATRGTNTWAASAHGNDAPPASGKAARHSIADAGNTSTTISRTSASIRHSSPHHRSNCGRKPSPAPKSRRMFAKCSSRVCAERGERTRLDAGQIRLSLPRVHFNETRAQDGPTAPRALADRSFHW